MVALVILVALVMVLPVQAQVTATDMRPAFTNAMPMTLTNGTTTWSGGTNYAVDVAQGKPLGLYVKASGATGTLSNMTATVEFTPDGTNWCTAPTATFLFTMNGTTAVDCATNFPSDLVSNFRRARIKSIAGTPNCNYYLTNVYWLRR